MKKRYLVNMILLLFFIFGLMGCRREDVGELQEENGQDYFNGKVLEAYEEFLSVECLDVTSGAVMEGTEVHVSKKVASTNVVPNVQKGDIIRVVFTDVLEVYPPRLGTVWAIYMVDENGNVIAGEKLINQSERDTEQVAGDIIEPGIVEVTTENRNINDEKNWGIVLSATKVTPVGMTLLCRQSGGISTGELLTGSEYKLYVEKAGSWIEVPTVIKEYAWDAVAYMIPANDVREFEINWEWLYGELSVGTYRIGKEIMDFRGSGDYDTEWYYTEFEIQ